MEHPEQQPAPGKKNGAFQWFAVMVVVILIFYALQKSGCGPVKTEEKLEWIDR